MFSCNLKIGFMNINNFQSKTAGNKLQNEDFVALSSKFDVFGIAETHAKYDSDINITGFSNPFQSFRASKNHHKAFGGIAVFVKSSLMECNGVTKVRTSNENAVWIKLNKNVFGLSTDVFIGTIYLSPINSKNKATSNKLLYSLYEDIEKLSDMGSVIVMGDFNARTNSHDDFVDEVNIDDFLFENSDVSTALMKSRCDADNNSLSRNSEDLAPPCKRGRELLQLCKNLDLRIMNGRVVGDIKGKMTCFRWNGCSVVDYALCSSDLFDNINSFEVNNLLPTISDHCSIEIHFALPLNHYHNISIKKDTKIKLEKLPPRWKWNATTEQNFVDNIQGNSFAEKISQLKQMLTTEKNAVSPLIHLKTVLQGALQNSGCKSVRDTNKENFNKRWYDSECTKAKNDLVDSTKKLQNSPHDPDIRSSVNNKRKKYNSLVKSKKYKHKKRCLADMQSCSQNDKRFWNILNKMKDKSMTHKPPIPSGDIIKHYKSLLQSPKLKLKTNICTAHGPLDDTITSEEVLTTLGAMKKSRACGIDSITNDIMRAFIVNYPEFITALFNYILKSNEFPTEWSTSLLVPIHKKGSKSSITNYRGISLIPCFCKLFCSILNNRLMNWATSKQILSPGQLGFVKGNRTSDAITILHNSIFEYCNKRNSKLYSCFVDFEKAFDKIPRNLLLDKIYGLGITGNVFNILASMYTTDKCRIKIGNKMSPSFSINQGVRQGCVLSPTLFNLFLSDFEPLLAAESNIDRVEINENSLLSGILWADDILLLSETKRGLQNQLNFLEKYTESKELKINVSKTKCLCFNTTGKLVRNCFSINDDAIEDVNHFKYLGFVVSSNGKVSRGLKNLSDRANRAFFSLKSGLGSVYRQDVLLTLSLFDKAIKPILLYCSDFWGCHKHNLSEKGPIELTHCKICKDILGVSNYTSNSGTLYELGRKPIFLDGIKNCFNNWLRITGQEQCHIFLSQSVTQSLKTNSTWTENIKSIVKSCGIAFTWNNLGNFPPKGKLTKLLHQNIWKKFCIKINARMASPNSRLHHLYQLKSNEKDTPKYFTTIKNTKHRVAFSKLRLMNNLTSKHDNSLCTKCSLSPPSPRHLLMECPVYSDIRHTMFVEILKYSSFYRGLSVESQVLFLLADNEVSCTAVSKFAYAIFNAKMPQSVF